jgi:succinate dehydrogenase / fumarate reductase flavoprotein subunit
VFGKSAGETVVEDFQSGQLTLKPLPDDAADVSLARLNRSENQTNGEDVHEVRLAMQRTMQKHAGVFRFNDLLKEGVERILEVAERAKTTQIKDKSKVWNTARIEALELDNLIEVAKATMISAEARKESRGAHVRDDALDTAETPAGRDDKNWLKHTLWYSEGNRLDYKPVNMKPMSDDVEPIALAKRTY